MNALVEHQSGELRIDASTNVAQYVLPPILAQFHQRFHDVKVSMLNGNTEHMEEALLRKEIDLGIIEGISRNPQIRYQELLKDEIVLVSRTGNKGLKKKVLKLEDLKSYPLLLRKPGSGTLEVIAHTLKSHQIKLSDLNVEMQLGGTESIKSYLLHSNYLAFLSVHAVIKELKAGECKIIDVEGLTIERPFYMIQAHGQPSSLAALFLRFAKTQRDN